MEEQRKEMGKNLAMNNNSHTWTFFLSKHLRKQMCSFTGMFEMGSKM